MIEEIYKRLKNNHLRVDDSASGLAEKEWLLFMRSLLRYCKGESSSILPVHQSSRAMRVWFKDIVYELAMKTTLAQKHVDKLEDSISAANGTVVRITNKINKKAGSIKQIEENAARYDEATKEKENKLKGERSSF